MKQLNTDKMHSAVGRIAGHMQEGCSSYDENSQIRKY